MLPSEWAPFLVKHIQMVYVALSQITADQVSTSGEALTRADVTFRVQKLYSKIFSGRLESSIWRPLTRSFLPRQPFPFSEDKFKVLGRLWGSLPGYKGVSESKIEMIGSGQKPEISRFTSWLEGFCKIEIGLSWMEGQLIPVPCEKGEGACNSIS